MLPNWSPFGLHCRNGALVFHYSLPATHHVSKETSTMLFALYTHNTTRLVFKLCAVRFRVLSLVLFISQIKWWNSSFRWHRNTLSDCGGMNTYRGSDTDVGCWGMTVVRTVSLWCTASVNNHWRFSAVFCLRLSFPVNWCVAKYIFKKRKMVAFHCG